jgi:hypothetical protein
MSLLDRIKACNNVTDVTSYLPFFVSDVRVGWIHHDFVHALLPFDDCFTVEVNSVRLAGHLGGYHSRTVAVDQVMRTLNKAGWFSGWRSEPYGIGRGFYEKPFFEMERAAVPRFGVAGYGVHVNGFVKDGDELLMWIARRADDKPTYPGMLDNMVAGGQPVGLGLLENVIKESAEEASVPRKIADMAKPAGVISYQHEEDNCLKPDTMFVFDMELPRDFVPKNIDGELAGFQLLPVRKVMEITANTTDFKFNCAAVIIDFFVRHGILGPEDPEYIEIQRGLHR